MTDDEIIVALLSELTPERPASVTLDDGRQCVVHDIAWGRDFGDEHHHLTTNISPGHADARIDFFYTSDVVAIQIAGALVYARD